MPIKYLVINLTIYQSKKIKNQRQILVVKLRNIYLIDLSSSAIPNRPTLELTAWILLAVLLTALYSYIGLFIFLLS